MTTAEIITIGTELLLGEIQDTNTAYLARQFRHLGIDLYRVTTIGDNPLRIADTIRESLSRADVIVTTGGLGPTIDDPTRNAAAIAFNSDVVFHTELWESIKNRFLSREILPTENNKKQAYLPAEAVAIENPVGTAPAFYILKNNRMLVCLPGVPAEMEAIFQRSVIPLLNNFFNLDSVIKSRVLHTSGIGESAIDDAIGEFEKMNNPTVGLSAHPGSTDIRITAKSTTEDEAVRMIDIIDHQIRQRLPGAIFGKDHETLILVIASLARELGKTLRLHLYGLSLDLFQDSVTGTPDWLNLDRLEAPFILEEVKATSPQEEVFAVNFLKDNGAASLELIHISGHYHESKARNYNGPMEQAEQWGKTICLDFIWRTLNKLKPEP